MKKILTTILIAIIACGSTFAVGCGSTENPYADMTTLYLGVFQGGIGVSWLDDIVADFEEKYKGVSFEAGKTGIHIDIDEDKNDYESSKIIANARYMDQDIFIVNDCNLRTFYENDVVKDITDILTEKVYLNGEVVSGGATESILDSFLDSYKSGYNLGTEAQPKYYGIPYTMTTTGIVYDGDLFTEKGFYFNTDGELICDSDNGELSYGNDGVPGTYDDGCPQTWEQFVSMMDAMVSQGIIPFTWANNVLSYRLHPLVGLMANYEGANDFMLNYTFEGTDTSLGEITPRNAYKLYGQEGRKAALKAAADIISDSRYYSVKGFYSTQTHLIAQEEFVRSKNQSARIAMIFEGGWWENEAREVFDLMPNQAVNGYGKRNFKIMPMPKFIGTEGVDNQTNTKQTVYLGSGANFICVNKYSEKDEPIKLFLQELNSARACAHFTKTTGVARALNYELSGKEISELTPFARSMWEYLSDENVDKVVAISLNNSLRHNMGSTILYKELYSQIGSTRYDDPLRCFYDNKDITVEDYFNGMSVYYSQSMWETECNKYGI